MSSSANEVLIAFNPKAGARSRRHAVDALRLRLSGLGLQVDVEPNLDRLADRATQRFEDKRLRAVVAAGGDGTAAEIVNRTPPGVPLAMFPLGTENLLAKFAGIGTDIDSACGAIATGAPVRLDAGRANGRIFLLMASCGFDADVVYRLHSGRNGNIRHWSYAKPIWQSIRKYKYPLLHIRYRRAASAVEEAESIELDARWAFVFNLPCYARGIPFVPSAVATDGKLDLCTFRRGGFSRGLWYLSWVLMRKHERLPDCSRDELTHLHIESEEDVAYQLDGDAMGHLPLDIEVLPGRLTLLVPPQWLAVRASQSKRLSNLQPRFAQECSGAR